MIASFVTPRRGRARRALVFVGLLLALLLAAAPARAQGDLATGTAPAPLAGTGAVTFVSQAVDATLYRTDDGLYWVDVESVIRLHNTDRFNAAAVTLGWPGWPGGNLRFDPTQLPGFSPAKGGAPLGTRLETRATEWGGEARESTWLVAQTSLAPDSRERITMGWQQPLGEGPLLTYTFGLVPAGAWAGPVGSARITLALPGFSSEEIVVRADPGDYTFDGDSVEWVLVEEEPSGNPAVTLIAPHVWREIEAARAARESDPLGANLRLAEQYAALAAAGAPLYDAEAEAALEAARRAAPDDPEPLRRLAALFRARAERTGGDLAAREQAATLGEAALAAGAADEATRAAVVSDLQALAEAWREPDPALALDFLARAAAASGDEAAFAEQRRALAESLALAALARGDVAAAQRLAAEHGLPTDVAPLPWLSSAAVRIENAGDTRTVTLLATGEEPALSERLGGLAARLDASGYPATWDAATGTLSIQFRGDENDWGQGGQVVASALGEEPEWALLREALTPGLIQYRLVEETLEQRYGYREQLQVANRAAERAADLQQRAAASESEWERALLAGAADRWQALADSQSLSVATRFAVSGGVVQREWTRVPPTDDVLEWRGSASRRDRWLLVGAGGALALFLLLGLIWLPGRR